MYKSGNSDNLNLIDLKTLRNFIFSSLDEINYFGCSKGNILSLRDYFLELKSMKAEYKKLIKVPLMSIQSKNPWCIDIQPIIERAFIIDAIAKNRPTIGVLEDNGKLNYAGIALSSNPFIRHLILKRWIERRKIIENSKEEIEEIKKIISSIGLTDNINMISASNYFMINTYNFNTLHMVSTGVNNDFYSATLSFNDDGNCTIDFYCCSLSENDVLNKKECKKYGNEIVKKLYLVKK